MTAEDRLIADLAAICATAAPERVLLGIGDDAAVWQPSRSHRSVITTDALVEDVHFTRASMSAADVGWRALAANLSDIAAMGARPVLAVIALAVGPNTDGDWLRACYTGMAELARGSRCALAGGDVTRGPATMLAITVVGEVRASNCTTRSGGRPGDIIAVTGPLGASRAGLTVAHLRPELVDPERDAAVLEAFRRPVPRLREGRWLGASAHVHALMDSSDGLSTDLARLCRSSGLGAIIDDVPIAPGAAAVAAVAGDDPVAYALDGGEDFELVAVIAPRAFSHLAGRFMAHFGRPLLRVGRLTAESEIRRADGSIVAAGGWDHLAAPGR